MPTILRAKGKSEWFSVDELRPQLLNGKLVTILKDTLYCLVTEAAKLGIETDSVFIDRITEEVRARRSSEEVLLEKREKKIIKTEKKIAKKEKVEKNDSRRAPKSRKKTKAKRGRKRKLGTD